MPDCPVQGASIEFGPVKQLNPDNACAGDKNKGAVPQEEPCMPPEQDQYLPIASVTRIMRNAFGYDRKYISFVTAEASETCQSERRTTITAGDMLSAMSNLGFEDYVEPLNVFIHRYRLSETDRGCSLRGETSSFDPAYGGSGTGFHGPPPPGPYGCGMLDQSMVLGGGDQYYPNGSGQDSITGGGGSSSSMNGMPLCDHCGHYK
ncbi:PREDICTED: nuclear transcription factor Y subunit B-9-like [Brassica oleracea var. oleracea]|uniref:nuclear transcription factor Y subunit B-9-like n=1 Tax=Brassica oleracea var. oleracea TaxID=109376 RepID=UPI0006A6F577|nr:PREDICTED: nuclear transcription factor Y subunit B-9-like [Brassica oleracea var. oleracea]